VKKTNLNSNRRIRSKMLSGIPVRYAHLGSLMLLGTTVGALALLSPQRAEAFNLYNGTYGDQNLEINLETTVSYSTFYRVNDPSAILLDNVNGDEGDRDFRHGFVDNTFDVLPVFDLKYGSFGMHVSGEAFIDTPYLSKNQDNSPGTFNPISTSDNQSFTSATRDVNGRNAVLLDAFVYDGINFGAEDQQTLTVKFGRQTLLWGQSLFFASNGISAGQAPLDIIKAQSLPNAQAQQIFLPVGQAVVTYQPNQNLTLQAYYQFEWEHDTFQGVGSYFSSSDVLDKGGQRILLGQAFGFPPQAIALYRAKDLSPPIENGQFGASVQGTIGEYDLGLYALRYDSKAPAVYTSGPFPGQGPGNAGSYYLVYPRDIQIYGASFSTDLGDANVAGEISGRRNMNLVAAGFGASPVYPGSANAGGLYPKGSTVAAQVSTIYVSPGVPFIPGGISYAAEAAINHVISVDANRAALATGRQATAAAVEFTITPNYYSVLPKLDISFPIGITYDVLGRSQVDSTMNHGTGNFSIGVSATYRTTWFATLTYKDFLGKADQTLNPTADRGYIDLNLQHTF
jgi:hypothetical protein